MGQDGSLDDCAKAGGEDARDVLHESAAGEVRQPFDLGGAADGAHVRQIGTVRLDQRLAKRAAPAPPHICHSFPAERCGGRAEKAVGVQAAGGQADEDIAWGDVCAGDDLVLFYAAMNRCRRKKWRRSKRRHAKIRR